MSASIAPECNDVKDRYDKCFLKFFSEKFLQGTATHDECAPLFERYQECLGKALKEKGIERVIKDAMEKSAKEYGTDGNTAK